MMDTDYEHYAIVYSQQKDSQEPSTMLQLYSGCLSNGGGGGKLGSSLPPKAIASAPSVPAPTHAQRVHFGVNKT